jgi:drug/metabolite transporter (DMT)-like permease
MAVVLGLLVALTYGSGDFFGGIAAARTRPTSVVFGSFAISGACLIVVTGGWALVGGLPSPDGNDVWLGVAAGCVGPVAVGLLYRGLAIGRMSVVAPITAVVAAVVPFGWGLSQGERPSTTALVGVAVALVAVALISGAPTHPDDLTTQGGTSPALLATAVASGFGFGVIFILFGSVGDGAGLWPILWARATAVTALVVVLVGWHRSRGGAARPWLVPNAGSWGPVAGAGVLDVTANALYLAGTQRGLLSLVAVLSSLYPAATVVLARVFLGERLHRVQVVGLALAAAGVAAIAAA